MIVLGLTAFNRRHLLWHSAASLRPLISDRCRLFIVNDASSEFSERELQELLPRAVIHTNRQNSGRADFAIVQLAHILVGQGAQYAALLDSDLMYHPSFLETIFAAMPHTDGIMTTLNSDSHKVSSPFRLPIPGLDNALVQKARVGSAGVVWSSELLADVLEHVPASPTWDWDYGAYLQKNNRRILSVESSVVQHLGFWVGQNSSRMNGDWGLGYPSLDAQQASVVSEMICLGTKAAFLAAAEDRATKYLSGHNFRPFGTIWGRSRVFSLCEALSIETKLRLDEAYYYISLDATLARPIYALLPQRGAVELSVVVLDRNGIDQTLCSKKLPIAKLGRGQANQELCMEFYSTAPTPAILGIRYHGPRSRSRLHLNGVMIDQID